MLTERFRSVHVSQERQDPETHLVYKPQPLFLSLTTYSYRLRSGVVVAAQVDVKRRSLIMKGHIAALRGACHHEIEAFTCIADLRR